MKTEAEMEAEVRRAFGHWQICIAEEEFAELNFKKNIEKLRKSYPKNGLVKTLEDGA